jgi:hypothetical protein
VTLLLPNKQKRQENNTSCYCLAFLALQNLHINHQKQQALFTGLLRGLGVAFNKRNPQNYLSNAPDDVQASASQAPNPR